jgi:hypothetical protein
MSVPAGEGVGVRLADAPGGRGVEVARFNPVGPDGGPVRQAPHRDDNTKRLIEYFVRRAPS